MTGAVRELPTPAQRDPWLAIADFLANEADALKSDPRFAAVIRSATHRPAIPLPAAVVADRTCSAVAQSCSDLLASGNFARPPLSSPATGSPSYGAARRTAGVV